MAKPPASGVLPGNGTGLDRSLDQVIIEYLAAEAASERLELGLMKGGELVSGEAVALSVRAATSLTDRPVPGAHITLRVVSNLGPTQVLYRGVTGGDGLVKVTATLPDIGARQRRPDRLRDLRAGQPGDQAAHSPEDRLAPSGSRALHGT